jgi:hypothetical protein
MLIGLIYHQYQNFLIKFIIDFYLFLFLFVYKNHLSILEKILDIIKMFMTRSEYDRGVNTFSPEGRLFQVEYAIEAIKFGTTAIGIMTQEGVVLATEKRITSVLIEPRSIEKIVEIDAQLVYSIKIFFKFFLLVAVVPCLV